jgi:uncharacterized membrane protein YcaP (DUF421 family)
MIFFDGWQPIVRTLVIGPLAFVSLILLLRTSGKRTLSQLNAFDFVITVALGSLLATVIVTEDVTLLAGVVAFTVLIALQFVITWVSVRVRRFERFVKAEASLLYRSGEMQRVAMRRCRVTEREVEATVRRAGLPNLDAAGAVVLEADGSVSVIERGGEIRLPYVVGAAGYRRDSGDPDEE